MRRFLRNLLFAALFCASAAVPTASAQETVVVTNRVVYPGETVTNEALDEVPLRRQLNNPASIAMVHEQIAGKVARRTLLPGRLIALNSVRDAYLVEAGARVQVLFVHGGLEIAISGVPLQPGAAGDVVQVRNLDSGIVFSGTVMADGTIRVSAT